MPRRIVGGQTGRGLPQTRQPSEGPHEPSRMGCAVSVMPPAPDGARLMVLDGQEVRACAGWRRTSARTSSFATTHASCRVARLPGRHRPVSCNRPELGGDRRAVEQKGHRPPITAWPRLAPNGLDRRPSTSDNEIRRAAEAAGLFANHLIRQAPLGEQSPEFVD